MADRVYFTLKGIYRAVIVDYTDTGTEPDLQGISGLVTITPSVTEIPAPTLTPNPETIVLAPMLVRLDEDGILKTIQGDPGVRLTANSEVLGPLPELLYTLTFDKVRYNKRAQTLTAFAFRAPSTDTVVDLSVVEHLPPVVKRAW
ncbi:hypothetical protein [Mycobacteroides abscessus]